MNKIVYSLLIVLFLSSVVISVFAQVSVGLIEGIWVEYTAIYTGNPPDTYPATARIEVKTIQETLITVEIERTLLNGTQTSRTENFDLESGAPDLIVIPAFLGEGDEVYHEDWGNFTLEGVAEYSFEGATRDLVYANVRQTEFSWDRTTGILIEAEQITEIFTQKFTAINSNIVPTEGLDIYAMLLYLAIIAIIIILVVVVLFIFKRK